jgi:Flp pilus assembly protein TadG
MLEFVMVFPMALVVVMFAFDVAKVYMAMNATQYAASTSVHKAASWGAAGIDGATCADAVTPVRGDAKVLDTFCEKLRSLPGGAMVDAGITSIDVTPNAYDSSTNVHGGCSDTSQTVRINVKLSLPSVIPGLGTLLGTVTGGDGQWHVEVTEEARCEINA